MHGPDSLADGSGEFFSARAQSIGGHECTTGARDTRAHRPDRTPQHLRSFCIGQSKDLRENQRLSPLWIERSQKHVHFHHVLVARPRRRTLLIRHHRPIDTVRDTRTRHCRANLIDNHPTSNREQPRPSRRLRNEPGKALDCSQERLLSEVVRTGHSAQMGDEAPHVALCLTDECLQRAGITSPRLESKRGHPIIDVLLIRHNQTIAFDLSGTFRPPYATIFTWTAK